MANKNILTNGAKLNSISQNYYSPVSTVFTTGLPLTTFYCFLAKVDPWGDNTNPPVPTQDQLSLKRIYKNIFATKKINTNDISGVIERIDWEANTTYTYYQDNIDMLELDNNGFLINKFYVKNKYDQVFKCLWNNNGAESTIEPYFEPGTYGSNNIFLGADGYKWKFIYTVDIGAKVKFMDTSWIPVPMSSTAPNALQNSVGAGNIDVINILNGGSNYDPANAAISLVVTGDGTDAAGTVTVTDGMITDVIMTNTGSNYSYANVAISSTLGSGAIAISPVSPIAGHGSDPISELGCVHVMLTAEFNGNESGNIPTDIDFHQVGIIIDPTSLSDYPKPATSSIYKTTTDLVLAQGFGLYSPDEIIFQGTSLETATYTGVVLSFDAASNVLKLINIVGTPAINAPVFGDTSKTTRTLLTVSSPVYTTFSGHIAFIENRTGIQRSEDGIEQFKFVLGF